MEIREYQPEDEESWLRCRVLAFLHTAYYDDVYQQKEVYAHPSIELVAIEKGQVIGLIDVEYETEKHTVCAACSALGAMIWHLAVHPDFQRSGIGTALLIATEKKLKSLNIFQLEAYTRDDAWVNLWYQKNGFHQVSHYLHIFMEGNELNGTIHATDPHLKPKFCFAQYTGADETLIKKRFSRVHECRCYRKNL
ncbi:GNAT family N-acetyltransferase [Sporolactobacillus sp. CPB3-1]|uniref:GNAT family N-acetyltransferase n=1 Tax=Sporolactobacillus mangiferae TaxID=2940498 RepID=A0ABT0MAU3_9BACL|nr:GNAT family N-acetyltransferase [Sporolactobacillus mangiferae]MCL1631995.1 GNAT family N-acetyltransferase [Sporolactobacillus mangiferae]